MFDPLHPRVPDPESIGDLKVGDHVRINHKIYCGMDALDTVWTGKTGVITGFWTRLALDGTKICDMVKVSLDDRDSENPVSFDVKFIEKL